MPTTQYRDVYYPMFGIDKYHSQGTYGAGVSIYVIDTGMSNAEDTLANVKVRQNGKSVRPIKESKRHGSFVSTILARPQDPMRPESIPGIAPEAEIFLSDVTGPDGLIYTSYLTKAIQDATALGADIISVSLGTTVYDKGLNEAVESAVKRGSLVLAASGNCSCRAYEYPAACESAISVASMDQEGWPSPFNTRNDLVTIFAPGQSIAVPGSSIKLSGTSFATPFASGLLALEWSKRRLSNPDFTFTRDSAIEFLRQKFQLECNRHSYLTGPCCGMTGTVLTRPNESNGLLGFMALFFGGAALGLLGAYAMDKRMPKQPKGLSGGFTFTPGPLSWFGLH
jgi:subtilisin family serine protease